MHLNEIHKKLSVSEEEVKISSLTDDFLIFCRNKNEDKYNFKKVVCLEFFISLYSHTFNYFLIVTVFQILNDLYQFFNDAGFHRF